MYNNMYSQLVPSSWCTKESTHQVSPSLLTILRPSLLTHHSSIITTLHPSLLTHPSSPLSSPFVFLFFCHLHSLPLDPLQRYLPCTGPRQGQDCVAKVFKTGSVYESSYFQNEMDVIAAAMNIVNRFNQSRVIDRHIYLNQPAV